MNLNEIRLRSNMYETYDMLIWISDLGYVCVQGIILSPFMKIISKT